MSRDYLTIPYQYREEMEALSNEEFGALIRALLDYSLDGTPVPTDGALKYFSNRVMNQEDEYQKNYAKIVKRNVENGKKGGRPRGTRASPNEPSGTQANPVKPSGTQRNPVEPKETQNNPKNPVGYSGFSEIQREDTNSSTPNKRNGNDSANAGISINESDSAEGETRETAETLEENPVGYFGFSWVRNRIDKNSIDKNRDRCSSSSINTTTTCTELLQGQDSEPFVSSVEGENPNNPENPVGFQHEGEETQTRPKEKGKAAQPELMPDLPGIPLASRDGELYFVTRADFETWVELYPAVNVAQEVRKMVGWCSANPAKRKTRRGVKRFINSWLSRTQDKGGNNGFNGGYSNGGPANGRSQSPSAFDSRYGDIDWDRLDGLHEG